jgi:membrane-associated protease RseP (regulator of RpoE activity)
VSSERPGFPEPPLGHPFDHLPADQADVTWAPRPARPKFRHNYRTHIILFLLTFLTTTATQGPLQLLWGFGLEAVRGFSWQMFAAGFWYSIPVLVILSAHEFGHYFACRYYNVDATLPYFLPSPLPFVGTFGAVIKIREAFPGKRALFDIGVAGPIAGFVVLLPFLLLGMKWSSVGPVPDGAIYFGEPLLWKLLERIYFGILPEGFDVFIHPMAMAAWWGTFATAMNLLPFGQLDGGHIAYAALGRRSTYLSALTLAVVVGLGFFSPNWILLALIMVGVSFAFGLGHPRVIDEDAPLDPARQLVTLLAVVIFIICFMPIPIEMVTPPGTNRP